MSVKKRGGRWYYDFMIKQTRYRGVVPEARTKWQAEQAETKIRLLVYEGKYGQVDGNGSFTDFVKETYLPWAKLNKRSWNDDRLIAGVLCEYFAGKKFSQITAMLVEKFKKERRESPTKRGTARQPATVNRELAVLSKVFTLAVEAGAATNNPCLRVKKLRQDNARTRYLSEEEEGRLMSALGTRPHLRPVVVLALNTGMRRGEILALKWEQVDLSRGVITVINTKSARDRMVPINARARAEFEALRSLPKLNEYVFRSPRTGGRLKWIKRAWGAACREAGLAGFRFHDLRHTAATRMGDTGADPFTIAEILGHADLRMTKRYTHATDEAKRRALERIGQAQNVCHKFVTKAKEQVG